MNIVNYSFEEYLSAIKSFHGNIAPGLVLGGFMVDLALKNLPEGEFFDAICETRNCLPDAIQLLTPCTIGNGWLKIVNLGRFAFALYEKCQGNGTRIFLDAGKLSPWPEIKNWYFKLKSKKEQDIEILLAQIKEAGSTICSLQNVRVHPDFLEKNNKGRITICPGCKEAYPSKDGEICRACQGESPYLLLKTQGESQVYEATYPTTLTLK
jgi:formylmethanofuran dehydrogenase subunit E